MCEHVRLEASDEPAEPWVQVHTEATPRLLRALRRRLGHWARAAGLGADEVSAVEIAAYEAMANAFDHAYPTGRPPR